jgi:hypothetical protein
MSSALGGGGGLGAGCCAKEIEADARKTNKTDRIKEPSKGQKGLSWPE